MSKSHPGPSNRRRRPGSCFKTSLDPRSVFRDKSGTVISQVPQPARSVLVPCYNYSILFVSKPLAPSVYFTSKLPRLHAAPWPLAPPFPQGACQSRQFSREVRNGCFAGRKKSEKFLVVRNPKFVFGEYAPELQGCLKFSKSAQVFFSFHGCLKNVYKRLHIYCMYI